MIPRLKPFLGTEELAALVHIDENAVSLFETAFANKFNTRYAIAFPYGRSALWAFFKSMGIENKEIIQPAYTCVVVAHATVLSGNIPIFVDINLTDFNMNLDLIASLINERTGAVIATHLFGYPMDVVRLRAIVKSAEARYGHKIWIIQDCAHSFGGYFEGNPVCSEDDAALFGLGISKTITSIFGGMLTTNNHSIMEKLTSWRDTHFKTTPKINSLRNIFYLLAVYPAFAEYFYNVVYWLQEATPFLNQFTKAYHLDWKIRFPPDYLEMMNPIQAQVGMVQLEKYDRIITARQKTALYYHENLPDSSGWIKPLIVEGATYSHYVIRVANREKLMKKMASNGVQLGQLIEYSVPHIDAYAPYSKGYTYPNSLYASLHTVNLPIFASLDEDQKHAIVSKLKRNFPESNDVK